MNAPELQQLVRVGGFVRLARFDGLVALDGLLFPGFGGLGLDHPNAPIARADQHTLRLREDLPKVPQGRREHVPVSGFIKARVIALVGAKGDQGQVVALVGEPRGQVTQIAAHPSRGGGARVSKQVHVQGGRRWGFAQFEALKTEGPLHHPNFQGGQRGGGLQRQGARPGLWVQTDQGLCFAIHADGQLRVARAFAVVEHLQAGVAGLALGIAQVQRQRGPGPLGHQAGHARAGGTGRIGMGISHLAAPFTRQTGFAHQPTHATMAHTGMDKAAAHGGVGRRQLALQLVAEEGRRHVAVTPNRDAPAAWVGRPCGGRACRL